MVYQLAVFILLVLTACEHETGNQRTAKSSQCPCETTLIEFSMEDEQYDEDTDSWYLSDHRIRVSTLVKVYLRRFYSNTGTPYLVPLEDRMEIHVTEGMLRIVDRDSHLRFQTVVIVLMFTQDLASDAQSHGSELGIDSSVSSEGDRWRQILRSHGSDLGLDSETGEIVDWDRYQAARVRFGLEPSVLAPVEQKATR